MALTAEQSKDLKNLLSIVELGEGLGSPSMPCSIAAINLALSGKLTDEIPDCMSLVIGKWVIAVQDLMPDGTRNCRQWKDLLPLAAGTGRDREKEEKRFHLLADWMWERVLPLISTEGWPAEAVEAWEKALKARSPYIAIEAKQLVRLCKVQLAPIYAVWRSQLRLIGDLGSAGEDIAIAAVYTTRNISQDWEEGVWDDPDGLDVIGTLERLIEV